MAVHLDHTIVNSTDAGTSATFLAEMLGLPAPKPDGPFMAVQSDNGVSFDFATTDRAIVPQHYAFLVDNDTWDAGYARVIERGLSYWADPHRHRPGEISHEGGGRRIYFEDPDGHLLEIFTR
jgi:catechol 2,3-dioxygenase-like lactoylglutathione lyase family enzyme